MAETTLSSFETPSLPFAMEAEQAVLGAVLKDPTCMPQVQLILRPEHFFLPQHQAIYTQMIVQELGGGKIDPLILLDALTRDKVYDDAGGRQYLFQLSQSVPSTANVEYYCHIVRAKAMLRALIEISRDTIDAASNEAETPDVLLDAAEQRLYDLRSGKGTNLPSLLIDVIYNEVIDRLQKMQNPETADEFRGLPTGYSQLDEIISGLNKSDLILIGARPAVGKTSVALNLARNVAASGKRVVFFCLEMTKMQLAQRLLSSEAQVESTLLRTGRIDERNWAKLLESAEALRPVPLFLDDTSSLTVSEMKARIRRMKDVDAIFVDYLGLISGETKSENRVQEVSRITRSLKMLAKDMHIPVVVCAQLSRASDQGGKLRRPGLSDLRESGSIEQDADIVLFLYPHEVEPGEGEEAPENDNIALLDIIVAKNRHGQTNTVTFHFDKQYTRITQIAQENGYDGGY
ncbi:MAG: replicative DNA helicase [Oscillospiraceae bacterium]|nr:replicative DNA helicase [Oscillospiraceae bacterium]